MEFLKKRDSAIVIFAAVVVVFSLLGCHRSLSKACRSVEEGFFTPESNAADNYYTCPGDQLGYCVKYANRLMAVISGCDELTENYTAVSNARQALDEALQSGDITDIYQANEALKKAVSDVETQVSAGAQLPQTNDNYDTIVSDFTSAEALAARSDYNDSVDAFVSSVVDVFPTGILRVLSGVKLPEKFA